jgi:hypothetical protein
VGAEGAIALGVSLTIPGACPRLTKFNISNNTVGDQGMIDENPIIGFSMSMKDPSFPALKKLNLSCKCLSFNNLTLSLSPPPLHFVVVFFTPSPLPPNTKFAKSATWEL